MKNLLLLAFPLLLGAQPATYGPGLQGDSLANTTLGPSGNEVSCRFRAEPGGTLRGIRPFIIWSFRKAGYHGGTGGMLKVELQADDGSTAHLPSGQALATSVQRLYIVPASDQFYPLITFDRNPALTRGAFYHVVFSNPHPLGEENFVSVNAIFSKVADRPRQPTRGDDDWAMLFRNKLHPAWTLRRTPGTGEGFTPIMEVSYAQGAGQGVGYMEIWMGAARPIGGASRVGELFTVRGGPKRIAGVAVRVRRLSGAGPLALRLETAAGKLLAEGRGGEDLAATPSGSLGGCGWVRAAFPAPITLDPGQTCRLVLAAAEDSRFEAFPLRKGTDKGFTNATVFGDGHAEFTKDGTWVGWEQWGKGGRTDSDLQFYFELNVK